MLFKLVIPYYNRQIHEVRIARWHKAPGDWVQFGEDLVDLHIAQIKEIKSTGDLKREIQMMTGPMAAQWLLADRAKNLLGPREAPPDMYVQAPSAFDIRVTASDMGKLRAILCGEGVPCQVGDAVAILGTEEDEPLGVAEEVVKTASAFRVVPNPQLCLCGEDETHVNG